MQKLSGKTAVVTGGNSGIGLATARLLIEAGARVIITGRNEKAVSDAVRELGKQAHGIVSDAGNSTDLFTLGEKVKAISPTIDILFANAGVGLFAPFEQTTEAIFDGNTDVNYKGVFFTVQQLLPLVPKGGSIILNATILTESGLPGTAAYSASKGAVLTLGRVLSMELAGRGIRVNTISPGPISTPIYSKMGMSEEELAAFAAGVQAKIPLQRFGEADDVAKAALFLAGAESNFMTGAELAVDGGKRLTF